MRPVAQRSRRSPDRVRADLAERLEARRPEIQEAILSRAHAVSDQRGQDAEYVEGLRAAIAAAVSYGLAAVERGEERCGPVPAAMLIQARHAARNHVELETVLRRYVAGYTALGDFLMHEARKESFAVDGATIYHAQRELAALFDRIVTSISAEYRSEAEQAMLPHEERVTRRVKRLLAGELVDTTAFDYDFGGWHLGAIATGAEAERALRNLAAALDCRLLRACDGERALWAWLGGQRGFEESELSETLSTACTSQVSLAIGEPARGLSGWRLTHRQAETAFTVALRRPRSLTRYADVALVAGILKDDDLVAFLTNTYLAPLAVDRDGGEVMRQTLRAYLTAGCNAASAAAILEVSRQTVTSRLRSAEERLGRALRTCGAELESALRLADIDWSIPQ